MTSQPLPAELTSALDELHRRLDAWASVVVGVAAEAASPTSALADPRLESAAEAFDDALSRFHGAMGRTLGLEPDSDSSDEEEMPSSDLLADDFFVHLVIGVPEGSPERKLDAAIDLVDEVAGTLVARVEAAGYAVPEWGVSRGEPDLEGFGDEE
jgi:hypothetical protein